MHRSDFSYHLPESLVAQVPTAVRSASRMLHLDRGAEPADRAITDLPLFLRRGDLLVLNNTRVMPARLRGRWESGGKFEILIERLLAEDRAIAQVRSGKRLRKGLVLPINGGVAAEVVDHHGGFYELCFLGGRPLEQVLAAHGEMPLPPYIRRLPQPLDRERYQTIFARREGAVAAPTAGLHFDDGLLAALGAAGVGVAEITLHIGAGTFKPVRTEDIAAHVMHREWAEVGPDACERIRAARAGGGRIVAVGTTVVRALETASARGSLEPFSGETDLFIMPGYRFRTVDVLLTNFHTPCSTLLMLVCAFAGTERILAAYRHAVRERYRFFSYGDAMLIAA